jgi:hypothetical protein
MKIKIKHLKVPESRSYMLGDIPNGTYFYGSISRSIRYMDTLFLKTYGQVVLVESPDATWDASGLMFEKVRFVKVSVTVEKELTRDEI